VFFCAPDPIATRVALLYDDGFGPYWAGVQLGVSGLDANGCRGQHVQEAPGRRYGLKSETAVSWSTSYTDVWLGPF
jgi:hypothetical protein